jgi:hypothetical protein
MIHFLLRNFFFVVLVKAFCLLKVLFLTLELDGLFIMPKGLLDVGFATGFASLGFAALGFGQVGFS